MQQRQGKCEIKLIYSALSLFPMPHPPDLAGAEVSATAERWTFWFPGLRRAMSSLGLLPLRLRAAPPTIHEHCDSAQLRRERFGCHFDQGMPDTRLTLAANVPFAGFGLG